MDRRRFLLTSLAGALAAPLAEAQQAGKAPRVGFLSAVPRSSPGIRAFEDRLREIGSIST
jgi:hypothetical protein